MVVHNSFLYNFIYTCYFNFFKEWELKTLFLQKMLKCVSSSCMVNWLHWLEPGPPNKNCRSPAMKTPSLQEVKTVENVDM